MEWSYPSFKHHLIVVEGFVHPIQPRSFVVWGSFNPK